MEVCWLRDGVVGSWNLSEKLKLICDFHFSFEHRAGSVVNMDVIWSKALQV